MTPSWTARARCVGRVEWTSDNPDDRVVVVGDGPRPSRGTRSMRTHSGDQETPSP